MPRGTKAQPGILAARAVLTCGPVLGPDSAIIKIRILAGFALLLCMPVANALELSLPKVALAEVPVEIRVAVDRQCLTIIQRTTEVHRATVARQNRIRTLLINIANGNLVSITRK